MDDKKYMQLALAEARKAAELGEIPIGAVLADMTTGEVIAAAHNMRETWHDATAHAEVIVIRKACERLGRWRAAVRFMLPLNPARCVAVRLSTAVSTALFMAAQM